MEKQKTINRYDSHKSETKHTKITYGLTRAHANIWGCLKTHLLTLCNILRLTSCFSTIYTYLQYVSMLTASAQNLLLLCCLR